MYPSSSKSVNMWEFQKLDSSLILVVCGKPNKLHVVVYFKINYKFFKL